MIFTRNVHVGYFQRWNKYTCTSHREENTFDNTPGCDKTIRLIYWWNLRKISFFFWTDTTIQRILGIHYSRYRSEGCSSNVMEQPNRAQFKRGRKFWDVLLYREIWSNEIAIINNKCDKMKLQIMVCVLYRPNINR